jgi:2'-5' RNA ligase
MVRTFIAIDLPAEITRKIADTRKVLAGSDAQLTFVSPDKMHITLKFIGEIPPTVVAAVQDLLPGLSFKPFEMHVQGISGNNPRRPRVIWAVGHDGGASASMNRIIEEALARLGIRQENRAFTPHITIARVKRFDPTILPRIEKIADLDFGTFPVRSMTFKKSTLTPKGPVYEDILEVPF